MFGDYVVLRFLAAPLGVGADVVTMAFVGSELSAVAGVGLTDTVPIILLASGAGILLGPAGFALMLILRNAVTIREMETAEIEFAKKIFGNDSLDFGRIRLTNILIGDTKRTVPSVDGLILVNLGSECLADPTRYQSKDYPVAGQVFIHELTHAWQICRNAFTTAIYFDAAAATIKGPSAYHPPPDASLPFSEHGLEQQATMIDQWYAWTVYQAMDVSQRAKLLSYYRAANNQVAADLPSYVTTDGQVYARYVEGNIRLARL